MHICQKAASNIDGLDIFSWTFFFFLSNLLNISKILNQSLAKIMLKNKCSQISKSQNVKYFKSVNPVTIM